MPFVVNGSPIRYDLVPVDYMADGMKNYIEHGVPPGSFMAALLANDLKGCCERADISNRGAIFEWVSWLWNYAPSECWGSPAKVKAWSDARRSEVEAHGN